HSFGFCDILTKSSLAKALPAVNTAVAQRPVASSNFRIVDPPSFRDQGLPQDAGPFSVLLPLLVAISGQSNLPKSENAFAQQGRPVNFFALWRVEPTHRRGCCGALNPFGGGCPREVCLDGAET